MGFDSKTFHSQINFEISPMYPSDQCVNVIWFIPVDSSGNCKRGTVPSCISASVKQHNVRKMTNF